MVHKTEDLLSVIRQNGARKSTQIKEFFSLPLNTLATMANTAALNLKKEFFAPIYVSSYCASSCAYCGFRKENQALRRRVLTAKEVEREAQFLKSGGYDAVYILSGSWKAGSASRVGSMTEVNCRGLRAVHKAGLFPVLESSPFSRENFVELHQAAGKQGRIVLFQEVYDPFEYKRLHNGDRFKGDPNLRLKQHLMAVDAGWEEVGIGCLLGATQNLVSELGALLAHEEFLNAYVNNVTISVPRIKTATGMEMMGACTDEEFLRCVYVIRILSNARIVLTGRESEEIRNRLWNVTDIWGAKGSTVPGGYTNPSPFDGQFQLADRRSISEIRLVHDN